MLCEYEIDGYKMCILHYSTATTFGGVGARLVLSVEQLAQMTEADEIVELIAKFQTHALEISAIDWAWRCNWSLQFLSVEQLLTIINSELSSDEEKRKAYDTLCGVSLASSDDDTSPEDKKKPDPGFVYLIDGGSGIYKIGKSANVENRMNALQSATHYTLKLVHVISAESMRETEKVLHRLFLE